MQKDEVQVKITGSYYDLSVIRDALYIASVYSKDYPYRNKVIKKAHRALHNILITAGIAGMEEDTLVITAGDPEEDFCY